MRLSPLRLALLTCWVLLYSSLAVAHEARPAYLELKETTPGQFAVVWRTPVLAGMRLPVALALPADLKNLSEPTVQELADSVVERRSIDAGANGLASKRIEFPGLQLTIADVLVRVEMLDVVSGRPSCIHRNPGSSSRPVSPPGALLAHTSSKASGTFSSVPTTCCSCLACC